MEVCIRPIKRDKDERLQVCRDSIDSELKHRANMECMWMPQVMDI